MKELPSFQQQNFQVVEDLLAQVLTNHISDETHLTTLIERADGSYRVLFDPAYFVLQEGYTAPTKSQWATLKKKLKRHDNRIFVFKEIGTIDNQCFLDFGYFST
ncbi:MAG: hypothetical protein H6673_01390 [Anaerolineales bacterium]|nr:hypothetical protein [Anaerolineales bacterium]